MLFVSFDSNNCFALFARVALCLTFSVDAVCSAVGVHAALPAALGNRLVVVLVAVVARCWSCQRRWWVVPNVRMGLSTLAELVRCFR